MDSEAYRRIHSAFDRRGFSLVISDTADGRWIASAWDRSRPVEECGGPAWAVGEGSTPVSAARSLLAAYVEISRRHARTRRATGS